MDSHRSEITKQSEIPTKGSDLVEVEEESSHQLSLASLHLLNKYGRGMKRLNREKPHELGYGATRDETGGQELSTIEVMKLARDRFIRYTSQSSGGGDLSMLIYPSSGAPSGLSDEDTKNLELILFLLASAEKVGNKKFDRAVKLLSMCDDLSPVTSNPVERFVFYFAEALRERINREMGKTSADHGHEGCETEQPLHVEEAVNDVQPAVFAWQQELPFVQVAQFTGIQAVLDSVASSKRIHFIDFGIRSGMNATVLMQALAVRHECPVELLKITAVATTSEPAVEETGKRLLSFADTINLTFLFKAVLVSDIKDLNEDVFEVEAGEAIAVYSPWFLRTMTSRPHRLEALIRVIRNLSPCVMVVTEIDANTDAPTFMDRFMEALFFFGSLFDCLEACINRCNPMRIKNEAMYMKYGIHNTVTTEGEERTTRHMKVDAWREFFGRFQMVEKELSSACFYQARLIVNKFACGSGCTFDMNGSCLLIGWKGTPISSLSAWKFLQEE